MKPHRILDPDQFHANRVCCSFGITEAIVAGIAFVGEAAAGAGAGLGFGAAEAAGAAGVGEAAGAALGAEGAAGLGAEALGAGAGLAGEAGLAGAGGGLFGAGEAALSGAGALDAAAAGIPTASALEAGAGAAGAAGASAIPAAGAVTSPLAALDAGAATGVLDAGAGAGGELGAAGGSLAGTAATDTLNPMNWLSFETVDAATGAPVASGTFPTAAETAANTAAANPFTASVGEAMPGLNAANDAIDTAASGFSAPSTGALANAGSSLAQSGSSLGSAALDSSGATSTFGNIMGGLKTVSPLVPLASLGMTLAKGQPGLPPQEQQVEGAAGNMLATGQQNLTMAANQQITAPQTAEIETWKQQQKNALYQLYAKSGRDPNTDTDYLQGLQQIEQQAIGMQQQFIDQLIKTGLGETGQATAALQAGAQMQIQQDKDFQQAISSAISSFGLTAGLSGLTLAKAA